MLIKAGTYRFNNELSAPSAELEQEIGFTCASYSDTFASNLSAVCLGLYVDADYMLYAVSSTEPDLTDYGITYPLSMFIYAFHDIEISNETHAKGWNAKFDKGIQTITIHKDIDASDEFGTWFYANVKEQKQISGKWRWNDVLSVPSVDLEQAVEFTTSPFIGDAVDNAVVVSDGTMSWCGINAWTDGTLEYLTSDGSQIYPFNSDNGWNYLAVIMAGFGLSNTEVLNGYGQTIDYGTTPKWVSVDYYDYVIANAKPVVASIHYNGSTIASLFGGQTATVKLKGDGVQVIPDIVFEVAEVSGGGGSCDKPHVIEVDELPTENIDEGAVYSCGGKYYKWESGQYDVRLCEDGQNLSGENDVPTLAEFFGFPIASYHYAQTLPTEGIEESTEEGLAVYYIEEANTLGIYFDGMWVGIGDVDDSIPFIGMITDPSESTEGGWYFINGQGFVQYSNTSGAMNITENGTYDVTDKVSVNVAVLDAAICGIWEIGSTDGVGDISVSAKVNFTDQDNRMMSYYDGISFYRYGDTCIIWYELGNEVYQAYSSTEGWYSGKETAVINFGAEPQMVSATFKELMAQIASPKYTIVQTE